MKLITISGLDGSGKSTQIELLKAYLESRGKKVFYFHAIQFGLANKLTKECFFCHSERSRGISRSSRRFTPQDDKNFKSITKANFFQIILRRIFLMIDIFRFKKLIKKLEKEGYNYIVSDRYFYDSVINIAYLSLSCHPEFISGSNLKIQEMLKQVQHDSYNIIKPNPAIYLQSDPEIIMQRERKPDQGVDYLKEKKQLYDNATPVWNLKIINGNGTKEEVFTEIKNLL